MAETLENFLFAIASPFAPAAKTFTGHAELNPFERSCCYFCNQSATSRHSELFFAGPALQYLPGLTAFFAASFVLAYIAWGLYGLSGKKRYIISIRLCLTQACKVFRWKVWCRGTLSSCAISILHGLLTCTLGFWQARSNTSGSLQKSAMPAGFTDRCLTCCSSAQTTPSHWTRQTMLVPISSCSSQQ